MTFQPTTRRLFLTTIASGAALASAAPVFGQDKISRLTREGRAELVSRPATPFAGAPAGDVVVVEFLDFNCPYCRKAAVTLGQLIAADPKVSVLYKVWPILGPVSLYAARAALATTWQDKYLAAHAILIDSPSRLASEAQVRDRLTLAGVDPARLDRDLVAHGPAIDAILARNNGEALGLGFTGTPGLVIGGFVVPGAISLEAMKSVVAEARRR